MSIFFLQISYSIYPNDIIHYYVSVYNILFCFFTIFAVELKRTKINDKTWSGSVRMNMFMTFFQRIPDGSTPQFQMFSMTHFITLLISLIIIYLVYKYSYLLKTSSQHSSHSTKQAPLSAKLVYPSDRSKRSDGYVYRLLNVF